MNAVENPRFVLALALPLLAVGIIVLWMFHPPDQQNGQLLAGFVGILIAMAKDCVGYFFQSSAGWDKKDAMLLAAAPGNGTAPPPAAPGSGVPISSSVATKAVVFLLAFAGSLVLLTMTSRPANAQVTGITKLAREVALKVLSKVLSTPDAQTDLKNALVLANAVTPPDYSGKCWQAMLDLGTNLPTAPAQTGLFTLYQEKRNLTIAPPSQWETNFHIACSPIFTDVSADVVGMGALLGINVGKIAGGLASRKIDLDSAIALALARHYHVNLAEFGIRPVHRAKPPIKLAAARAT